MHQAKTFKTLLFLILFIPFSLYGAGKSKFTSGLELKYNKNTTSSESMTVFNLNSATPTYTIMGQASGTNVFSVSRYGAFWLGNFTTASRTALTASAGTIVFDTDESALFTYNGSSWSEVGSGAGTYNNTDGATFSLNIISGSNVTVVTSTPIAGLATTTISANLTGSGTDAISIQQTNVNNASPTALLNTLLYDPNTLEYIASTPSNVRSINLATNSIFLQAGDNITIASATDSSSTTFTISSTGGGGGTDTITTSSTLGLTSVGTPDTQGEYWLQSGSGMTITRDTGASTTYTFTSTGITDPTTTIGDIIYRDGVGDLVRLPIVYDTAQYLGNNGSGLPEWSIPLNTITATTTLEVSGDFTPRSGEFFFNEGSGITIVDSTTGGSTTFTFSSTGGGGSGSTTATDSFNNSSEASWTVTAVSSWSVSLIDDSIKESRLNIDNAPSSEKFLKYTGSGLQWATATDTDTAYTNTATTTLNNSSVASWVVTNVSSWSFNLIDASIPESKLDINNAPTNDYVFSWNGSKFYWASATIIHPVSAGATATHNSLTGLQGGTAGEYYHLTAAEVATVTQQASSGVDGFLGGDDWDTFNNKATQDTITATQSHNTTAEISVNESPTSSFSYDLRDGSISEARLNISNAPVAEYFLKTDGTNLVWAVASNSVTATQTNTVTSSPTAVITTEITPSVDGSNGISATINSNSILEPKLGIENSPTAEYFLKWTGASMAWSIATDTNTGGTLTASPTGGLTTEASVSVSLTNVVSVDLVNNSILEPKLGIEGGPTAEYFLKWTGSSMTWAIATNSAGVDTITATDSFNDSAFISWSESPTASWSATLIDGSITEQKISISNAAASNKFLGWNGSDFIWRFASNTVTATQSNTVTSSPTAVITTEITPAVDGSNGISATLNAGSILESKLAIENAPTAERFLKWTGASLTWAVATDTDSGGTTTATDSFSDSSTISWTESPTASWSALVVDASLGEDKLNVSNAATANQFLSWNGSDFVWRFASDTVTATQSFSTTATQTFNTTAEISVNESPTSSFSFDLRNNSITEPRLEVDNGPTSEQFLKWTGSSLQWATASSSASADTVTSTTTLDLNGTTTNEPGEYFLSGGTNITVTQAGSAGSYTFTINSTVSPSGLSTYTMTFNTMSPTADDLGGTTQNTTQSVYLASSTQQYGVDFGNEQLPFEGWNGTDDIPLTIYVATPDAPGASDVVIVGKSQIIGDGDALWAADAYDIIGTQTITLASETVVQKIDLTFKIPVASLTLGDIIYLRFYRISDDAGDTHDDNLHFIGAAARVSQ